MKIKRGGDKGKEQSGKSGRKRGTYNGERFAGMDERKKETIHVRSENVSEIGRNGTWWK